MAALEQVVEKDTLIDDLRRQVRYEMNGLTLCAEERFAINAKYGLEQHTLTQGEKQAIALEETL
jgi:hypothetical protein